MTESGRIKYLRFALLAVGAIFLFGIYPLTILLAFGMVVAHGSVGLPADDPGYLRDVGRVSVNSLP